MKNSPVSQNLIIYQGQSGKIEFKGDLEKQTVWATQKQIAQLFGVNSQAITKHIRNIYSEFELDKSSTCSKMEQVQIEGNKRVKRLVYHYNLDMIISVGYRINSKQATQFRIWATKTLKQNLVDGYTINKTRIKTNYLNFMQAVSNIKALLPEGGIVKTEDVIELINVFADTWVSLDAYDTNNLPQNGLNKHAIEITAGELQQVLAKFKSELIRKSNASDLFLQEQNSDALKRIIETIYQSVAGQDAYPTVEEKAAHLLYFIVKNHPFVDGNKRSGAFSFVWFLRRAKLLRASFSPEAR